MPEPKRPRLRRAVLGAVFVLVLLAWGFALWYSVARPEPEPLDDTSRDRIRAACTSALDGLRALPPVTPGDGPREIAPLIDDENAIFTSMLDAVSEVSPPNPEGAEALTGWRDDWRRLLEARARHADELQETGKRIDFRIPAERGSSKPITVRMNEYARLKGLGECSSGTLQVEVVDVARQYAEPGE